MVAVESESKKESQSTAGDVVLYITYINIVLYALCYQLQRPVEPYLVKSLAANHDDPDQVSVIYSQLQSFFSAIQTIGSPLVGILLDRVGVRKASALVFLASALSYAILAGASSMNLLFLSKVPTVLQHAFLVAQAAAAISTGTNAAARAQALGRMTTAYTIGGTIGPALGGWLVDSMGDLYLGAKLAVVGSLVSVVLSMLFLPDGTPTTTTTTTKDTPDKTVPKVMERSFARDLHHSYQIAMRTNLWPLLVVKVVGGFAASMHSTALPLVLTQTLHFDPSQLGFCMSASMFSVAAFGAFAMAPLAHLLGPPSMGTIGLTMRAGLASLFALIVTASIGNGSNVVLRIVIAGVLHSLASHVLATGLTTQTTGNVEKSEQGALLGLEHGLHALARVGAPPTGSYLLLTGGFWSVAVACGAVDVALVGLLLSTAEQTQLQLLVSKDSEIHSD